MLNWTEIRGKMSEFGRNHLDSTKLGYTPLNLNQYRSYSKFRPGGELPIFCYLPFNSMTFSMSGRVYVCSYNKNILLGTYPQHSIDAIWNGEQAVKLREHMRHNDLSYGCGHCKFYFDKGKFSNLRPPSFDKYSAFTTGEFPRVLEFELSNECNLECQMCNGNVSSSIRKHRDGLSPLRNPYDKAFLQQLESYLLSVREAKFYGGEPFLIPMYYKIWERLLAVNPTCEVFVITNGTQWNGRIAALVEKLNLDLAISIDSLQKERLEKIRKNVSYDILMENINRMNSIMRNNGRHLSLSFTVQKENWQELPSFIAWCNSIQASAYISYLDDPKEFAITDLNKASLQEIVNTLSAFGLEDSTKLEKHNRRCLTDFISFVTQFIANENEVDYDEYAFVPDELRGKYPNVLPRQIVRVPKLIERSEMEHSVVHYIAQQDANHVSASEVMHKMDLVFETIPISELPKAFALAMQSGIAVTIQQLSAHSVEELRVRVLEKLPYVIVSE